MFYVHAGILHLVPSVCSCHSIWYNLPFWANPIQLSEIAKRDRRESERFWEWRKELNEIKTIIVVGYFCSSSRAFQLVSGITFRSETDVSILYDYTVSRFTVSRLTLQSLLSRPIHHMPILL